MNQIENPIEERVVASTQYFLATCEKLRVRS